MNLNLRKSVLLVGALASLGLSYTTEALATSPNFAVNSVQQSKKVTGNVSDAEGPIIGASVVEKGNPSNGAVTDLDGNFTLNVKPGATIVVTYIGYQKQEIAVGNQSSFKISMKTDDKTLDEVVVVGYGVQKKKLVTGATVQVKGEEIAGRNVISPLSALQNQSPGVNIVATSGKPGEGFNVNIRGAGTNGNTAPLYVIDGVVGDINSVNPADIESIDVLKDAASSAIYGARAANGVILVTTKQGKIGKVTTSYDGSIGWQNMTRIPKQLTAKQYMDIQDMTNINDGKAPHDWAAFIPADILAAYQDGSNPGTDWLEMLRNKNAVTTSHSLNVTGGSELSKFSTGIGYQYQDGIIGGSLAPSDFRRFTFRLNSEHILLKKGDRNVITFGENVYYQHRENKGIQIGNMYSNAIYSMLHTAPIIPAFNPDGSLFTGNDGAANGWNLLGINQYFGNPLNALLHSENSQNKSRSHNLNATAYITVSPIKGLTYKGLVYYKNFSNLWKGYTSVYYNNTNDQKTVDNLYENMATGWNWGMTHTMNYVFDLGKHHFDTLLGTEYSREGNGMAEGLGIQISGNIFENNWKYAYPANFSDRDGKVTLPITTSDDMKNKGAFDHSVLSYFGRINYDWNETYMLSLILRADGSSNFAPDHRWGWFPSVSGGWVVTNEKFMQPTSSWLDFLKIRASWGQNGNEGIGAYKYAATYSFGAFGQYSFNSNKESGTTGGYPARMANSELTWETSEQLDLGFDARFLNQRLGVNFDYYVKKTKDLLLDVPISAVNGFATQMANAGSVKNTGVELALSWNDRIGKDFTYNIGWNIATNKNEVTEVNNGSGYINGGEALLSQGTTFMARMEEGKPLGYFWGYKTNGVLQNQADVDRYKATLKDGDAANSLQGASLQPGDLWFVDNNGDGVINDDDKTEIGNPHPDVTMGINLGVGYKGFDLSVSGYAALGQQVAHSYRRFGDSLYDNWSTNVYNYWHGEGTGNGRYPRLTAGTNTNMIQVSDIYVDDASYFRLQTLTVGYDFTKIWKNSPFQQLRLYFQAQNLFTITGYDGMDPEQGSSIASESWVTGVDICNYPQPRTFLVGVNVKF